MAERLTDVKFEEKRYEVVEELQENLKDVKTLGELRSICYTTLDYNTTDWFDENEVTRTILEYQNWVFTDFEIEDEYGNNLQVYVEWDYEEFDPKKYDYNNFDLTFEEKDDIKICNVQVSRY